MAPILAGKWKVNVGRHFTTFYHHFTGYSLSTFHSALHRFLDGKFQSIAWGKRRAGPWKPQTGNYGRVVRIEQFFASREDGSERDSDHMAGITGLRGGLVSLNTDSPLA